MNCILCHESNDDVSLNSELCSTCFHLLRWFRGYLDVPDPTSITLDTAFVDLGVDSLDYIDWLMEAEEMFDVAITNAEAERINTVRKYLAMLRERGAVWAANKSMRLKRRGNWCPSYDWDVVTD